MDAYFQAVAALAGLVVGSFLNCLIWRLYQSEGVGGRSYCPRCRTEIAWHDNIPLLSFIMLRGRCRSCRQNISWQYPAVELATAILFWLVWSMHRELLVEFSLAASWLLARDLVIVVFSVVVFVYDFRWQLIPLHFVWLMSVLVLLFNLLSGVAWSAELVYGLVGAGFFLIQYFLTKKQGIGEGDIWLGLFLGLAFPAWTQLLVVLVFSYGLGSVVGLALLTTKKKQWKSALALGPFLALGAIVALLYGPELAAWYLGLAY